MKRTIATFLSLISIFSILSFSALGTTLDDGIRNFEFALRNIDLTVQNSQVVSQQTKEEFHAKVYSDIAWLDSKIEAARQAATDKERLTIYGEAYGRMIVITHEVRILLLRIDAESIDNVMSIAQQILDKAPAVIIYFQLNECHGTEELEVMIPQMQQNLDAAKQSHEAAKQKLSQVTFEMPMKEADAIMKEYRSMSKETYKYLEEVMRIGGEFVGVMEQIAAELQDKLDGKDTEC